MRKWYELLNCNDSMAGDILSFDCQFKIRLSNKSHFYRKNAKESGKTEKD